MGGSHIGNTGSISNLNNYLNHSGGRKFVVVSAIPGLLELVSASLGTIFHRELKAEKLTGEIFGFYTERAAGDIPEEYKKLASELVNLLKGIALIGDYSSGLKDQVLSFSEKLSVVILRSNWGKSKYPVNILLPEDIGLTASSDFGNATFLGIDKKAAADLDDGIYLVPGSYGVDENGKIVRAGYTSADYSAAFLTKELGTGKLELWNLDKDFLRADPALIADPPTIERLTYAEASELAYFEHYSFHPRTVEPLEHGHIPIVVIGSGSADGEVKTIINTETFVEDQIVKSVACTDDISLLKLDGPGVGLKPGILARATTQLHEAGINIKSVITSQTSINFILDEATADRALKMVKGLGFSSVKEISVVKDVSLIGVIGHGMQTSYGVSAKIFTAVANNKINVVLSGSGASDLVSYLVVHKSDKEKSVREIYNAFFN